MKQPDEGGLYTIAQAQEALHCSRAQIYNLHNKGRLELVKLESSTLVTERSVRKLIKELMEKPIVPRG
jgi:hypothetical protein